MPQDNLVRPTLSSVVLAHTTNSACPPAPATLSFIGGCLVLMLPRSRPHVDCGKSGGKVGKHIMLTAASRPNELSDVAVGSRARSAICFSVRAGLSLDGAGLSRAACHGPSGVLAGRGDYLADTWRVDSGVPYGFPGALLGSAAIAKRRKFSWCCGAGVVWKCFVLLVIQRLC
jgi:hypothetical protein